MDGDGYITIVDRLNDVVITGGENVFPAEVETVLAQHPAVADQANHLAVRRAELGGLYRISIPSTRA